MLYLRTAETEANFIILVHQVSSRSLLLAVGAKRTRKTIQRASISKTPPIHRRKGTATIWLRGWLPTSNTMMHFVIDHRMFSSDPDTSVVKYGKHPQCRRSSLPVVEENATYCNTAYFLFEIKQDIVSAAPHILLVRGSCFDFCYSWYGHISRVASSCTQALDRSKVTSHASPHLTYWDVMQFHGIPSFSTIVAGFPPCRGP